MVGGGGDDAVFKSVARSESEDAHGFDAHIMVGGVVDDGRVGIVGDGAGKNVGRAAARMRDADERNFDLLEGAVVVEVEAGKLTCANFGIDFDDAMNFFAGIAVALKADAGFEERDLDLSRRCLLRCGGFLRFLREKES